MSVYMTEEEQLESIKKWWNKYGNFISLFLFLVLLSIASYRYLQWHHEKITQQASIAYENMMVALSNQNIKSVRSFANELIQEHKGSVYADAAHLTLAKIFVNKNNLNKAINQLETVAISSTMPALKEIATIRSARILIAQKSYEMALKDLNSIQNKTYLPIINELKGDIFAATGNYQEAMNLYKLSLEEAKENGMANSFLEMKQNNIATKIHDKDKTTKFIKHA